MRLKMTFDYELLDILTVDEVESLLKSNKIPINDRHKINFWLGNIRMRTMGSIIGTVVGASLILNILKTKKNKVKNDSN